MTICLAGVPSVSSTRQPLDHLTSKLCTITATAAAPLARTQIDWLIIIDCLYVSTAVRGLTAVAPKSALSFLVYFATVSTNGTCRADCASDTIGRERERGSSKLNPPAASIRSPHRRGRAASSLRCCDFSNPRAAEFFREKRSRLAQIGFDIHQHRAEDLRSTQDRLRAL
jgi:hypothetical protein